MKAESASRQGMGPSGGHGVLGFLGCLGRDRRAAVALLVAVLLPVMLGAVALALEVGSWAVTRIQLQRRADVAAMTAATQYLAGSIASVAAGSGADLAMLNGAAATGRSWSGASSTLTSSDVTLAKVSGVISASDTAWQATVTQAMPLSFGRLLTTNTSVTVSASAIAEIVNGGGGGGQPCFLALGSSGTSLTVTGGSAISSAGCTVRSNGNISVSNGSMVTADWAYAGGTTSVTGNSSITDGTKNDTVTPTNYSTWTDAKPLYNNAGTISDPYANDTDITNAFSCLAADSCGASAGKVTNSGSQGAGSISNGNFTGGWSTSTITAGYYSSITSASGPISLGAGTYYVKGNVSIGQGATVTGTGVTLVVGGTVSFGGGATVTLSAPTDSATSGIPGVVIAGNSAASDTLNNGMNPTLTGLIYYPNGNLTLGGGVKAANSCLEVIANSITVGNGTVLGNSSNCNSTFGIPTFSSLPGTATVTLVQ
ncbi:MAG: hypothetical protein P4L83_09645 [Nevskia sp.]|nr:hypothetical protein [Nevskia sp.]